MKYVYLLFLIFLSANVNSQNTFNIEKIYLFDTKVWDEVVDDIDSSNIKAIEVDSLDCRRINNLINNSKSKAFPVYKPTANSLFGVALVNNEKIKIRIGGDVIFLAIGKKRHFFIKKGEDKEILLSFIEKYKLTPTIKD